MSMIRITNAEQADAAMLKSCTDRAIFMLTNRGAVQVDIHCIPPKAGSEFTEYLMLFEYSSGMKLTVGAVRRRAGAEVEFHS